MNYRKIINNTQYWLIFIVFISNIYIINSMEEKKNASPYIIIEDYHGSRFPITKATKKKCFMLKNCLEQKNEVIESEDPVFTRKDFDDGFGNVQDFSCSTDIPDISFLARNAANIPLTKNILTSAFDLIEHPEKCNEISKERIRAIFSVINFLSPKKMTVQKNLAERVLDIIPFQELNEDDALDSEIIEGIYGKSIGKIIKKYKGRENYVYLLHQTHINCNNMNIANLSGIENVEVDKNNITHLFLNNNKLIKLDIKKLLKIFPNLNHIEVCANRELRKIIFPSQLQNITMYLRENNIENLPEFYMNNNCTIDLQNNPLSPDANEKIKQALKLSPWKKNRHYFYVLRDIAPVFLTGGAITGISFFLGYCMGFLEHINHEEFKDLAIGNFMIKIMRLAAQEQLNDYNTSPIKLLGPYICSGLIGGIGAVSCLSFIRNLDYQQYKYVQSSKVLINNNRLHEK